MATIEFKEILFIINPHSGNKRVTNIVKSLNALNETPVFYITKTLLELEEVFVNNINKYKVFIVVGGDGTVSSATKYLAGKKDKILGILPTGSGNGFARELGFKRSLSSLLSDITKGESIAIDILSINNKQCINVSGLGFDSFVAHRFAKGKKRGLQRYIYHTIRSVFSFKSFEAQLQIDEKEIRGKFQMISIANTKQFGNNAKIAPMAVPNDGIFELVLVKPFPFILYPVFVFKLFTGSLKESKFIQFFEVKSRVNIQSNFKIFHIDGEPAEFKNDLQIKMLDEKIRVLKTSYNNYLIT